MLPQIEAGLDALQVAMLVGFDDFAKIRSDSSLKALRESERFNKIMDKFDEPLINPAAAKFFNKLFGAKK